MLEMARAFLERKGVAEARLESDLLVAHALDLDRLGLLMALERPVSGSEVDHARDLLVRRGRREPVAYIVGQREFYARSFRVDRRVLVPRPETELLVDLARDHVRDQALVAPRILDLGTGSGCLAVTLALEIPDARVTGIELSAPALEVARANAASLEAEVCFLQGDGLELGEREGPWEVVVVNPPYVDPAQAGSLEPEVREYEPAAALFAPAGDPDRWLRELVRRARAWLAPGGVLLIELGYDQGPRATSLAREAALNFRLHKDLAGFQRVLAVQGDPGPHPPPGPGAGDGAEPGA